MPMEIVLLPRDGYRINAPLSSAQLEAVDTIAAAFNGGRNPDDRLYQMQMPDGGNVDLRESLDHSAGFVALRNWDQQCADFVFQVMNATDRVAVLINQSPNVVLSQAEDVSLEEAGYPRGAYSLRLVASAEQVQLEVQRSFESWSEYRGQVVNGFRPSMLSRLSTFFRGSGA